MPDNNLTLTTAGKIEQRQTELQEDVTDTIARKYNRYVLIVGDDIYSDDNISSLLCDAVFSNSGMKAVDKFISIYSNLISSELNSDSDNNYASGTATLCPSDSLFLRHYLLKDNNPDLISAELDRLDYNFDHLFSTADFQDRIQLYDTDDNSDLENLAGYLYCNNLI